MGKFTTFKNLLVNDPKEILSVLLLKMTKAHLLNWVPDEPYIKILYWCYTYKRLNLENPQSFCEKLQWLKLYNRKEYFTRMVDKAESKKYVSEILGTDEYVVPTLGIWNTFEEIDFDLLPNQFVLKCTHDSKSIVICRNKATFPYDEARKKITDHLRNNFFYWGREWPYKNVKPCIIAEEYLEDTELSELRDYKFYCFNGVPTYCQVISGRSTNETIDFFDMEWNHLPFTGLAKSGHPNCKVSIPKPASLSEMKRLAAVLSKDIPFLRCDFYNIEGRVYFGELTLYPASGFGVFSPDEWNYTLGEMIKL